MLGGSFEWLIEVDLKMAVGESSRYAVIGGTSLLKSKFFESFKDKLVETEHGTVALKEDPS